MSEQEVVSQLLDGDVAPERAAEAVGQVASDPAVRDRWTRYALIGDVIRGNATLDDGFSIRILARLRAEGLMRDDDPL